MSKILVNRVPYSQLGLAKKDEQKLKTGFEIWEVLTAFTLIFTLATTLLWFSNLQPARQKHEFVKMEQYKSEIYNQTLVAEKTSQALPAQFKTEYKETCFVESWSMQVPKNSEQSAQLGKKLEQLNQTQAKIKTDFYFLRDKNRINNYLEQSKNYQEKNKQLYNEYIKYQEQKLELEQMLSKLCIEEFKDISTILPEFKEKSEDFLDNDLISEDVKNLTEKLIGNLEIMHDFMMAPSDTGVLQEETGKFGEYMNWFFANNLDINQLSELKKAKQDFEDSLIDLEKWQVEYLKNDPQLENKIVFLILEK